MLFCVEVFPTSPVSFSNSYILPAPPLILYHVKSSQLLNIWGISDHIDKLMMYTLVSHKLWIKNLFPFGKAVWDPWNKWIKWCAKDSVNWIPSSFLPFILKGYCYLLSFFRQEFHWLNHHGAFWICILSECQTFCCYGEHIVSFGVSQTLATKSPLLPEFLIWWFHLGAQSFVSATGFQGTLLLLVAGPHAENHWYVMQNSKDEMDLPAF